MKYYLLKMEAAKSIDETANESIINSSSPKLVNESSSLPKSFDETYYLKQIIELKDEIIKLQNIIIKDKETIRELENKLKGQNYKKNYLIQNDEDTPETPNLIKTNENFNILEKEVIFKMDDLNAYYYTICILKDGRLAAAGYSTSIIIYNKKTFKSEITIKEHSKEGIFYLTQLKNNNFVSMGNDGYINIYNILEDKYLVLQKIKAHTSTINKLRELDNGRFMTCSDDCSIKFFFKDKNEYKEDYCFKDDICIYDILRTKEGEIVYSGCHNSNNNYYVRFYDLKSRKKIESVQINGINGYDYLYMISDIYLLVGVSNSILIFDVNQHRQIREIKCDGSSYITSFLKLDESTLLSTDYNGQIKQWIINDDNLILENTKEKAHNSNIYMIRKNNEGFIITCSYDKTIKIWN